ncbi:hypothetical protein, partial [Citrobacter sp. VF227]
PAARQRVTLLVTEPARLWLPRDAVGEFELDMMVTAWPAEEETVAPAPAPESVPQVPLTPAIPDAAAITALLYGGGVFQG